MNFLTGSAVPDNSLQQLYGYPDLQFLRFCNDRVAMELTASQGGRENDAWQNLLKGKSTRSVTFHANTTHTQLCLRMAWFLLVLEHKSLITAQRYLSLFIWLEVPPKIP